MPWPPAPENSGLEDVDDGTWLDLVRQCVTKFPRASAPGPSGLRPSHLQDALRRRGGGLTLAAALARLCRLWCTGGLPQSHSPYWCGAQLIPLRKANNGVRPVAIGDTLRRLAGKVLLATGPSRQAVHKLAPIQVGVGVAGAAEAVAMTVQGLVSELASTNDWVLLKVDLRNAFNCVSRHSLLQGAKALVPSAFSFLSYAYTQEAPLFLGNETLWSRTGTHQGCPLGPLGFALGIHDLVQGAA